MNISKEDLLKMTLITVVMGTIAAVMIFGEVPDPTITGG